MCAVYGYRRAEVLGRPDVLRLLRVAGGGLMPRTVAHRELRNNSAAILREVAAGETIAITNHGEIVAMLVPAPRGAVAGALRSRPATKTGGFSTLPRTRLDRPVQDDLDGSRGER